GLGKFPLSPIADSVKSKHPQNAKVSVARILSFLSAPFQIKSFFKIKFQRKKKSIVMSRESKQQPSTRGYTEAP
ncbi:hypothetical protein ACQP3J_33710, partial [Escherichia coli]